MEKFCLIGGVYKPIRIKDWGLRIEDWGLRIEDRGPCTEYWVQSTQKSSKKNSHPSLKIQSILKPLYVVRINKCLLRDSLMSVGLRKIKLHGQLQDGHMCIAPSLYFSKIYICIWATFLSSWHLSCNPHWFQVPNYDLIMGIRELTLQHATTHIHINVQVIIRPCQGHPGGSKKIKLSPTPLPVLWKRAWWGWHLAK